MKNTMTNQVFSPSRRALLAGLGGIALTSGLRLPASAQAGPTLALRARPGTLALGAGLPPSQVWTLEAANTGALRFAKGDLTVTLSNELPAPIILNWLGIDGAQAAAELERDPARDLRADAHLQQDHAGLPDLRARVLPGHRLRPFRLAEREGGLEANPRRRVVGEGDPAGATRLCAGGLVAFERVPDVLAVVPERPAALGEPESAHHG